MAKYSVTFTRSARKELEALDEKIISVIFPKIENLSLIPRPVGCRKLVGNKYLYGLDAVITESFMPYMTIRK
jgi:mRNA-degrading endonuclease RelE of RelBE toxin-antitoxin system